MTYPTAEEQVRELEGQVGELTRKVTSLQHEVETLKKVAGEFSDLWRLLTTGKVEGIEVTAINYFDHAAEGDYGDMALGQVIHTGELLGIMRTLEGSGRKLRSCRIILGTIPEEGR